MLRPYQQTAIDLIRGEFQAGRKRVLLRLATGGGKTLCFCFIAKAALERFNRVLVVVRGRKLVDQASQRLKREGVPHGVFMANHPGWAPERFVQVCSIDTIVARDANLRADVIIVDEAHQATSKSYRSFLAQHPGAYILAVTATPYGPEPLEHLAESVIEPILEQELIDQGYLVPPKYFAPKSDIDFGSVGMRAGEFVERDLEREVMKSRIVGSVVTEYRKRAAGKTAIVFCVTVNHAQMLASEFNQAGIPARVLHAGTPDDEREDAIRSRDVLCNVGILGTGVDIPWLECVIMARPTMSLNLYLQQLGRGTRPYEGKTHFLLLDHAENVRRHGLMTDLREVDLKGTPRGKTNPNPVKTCEKCYCVYDARLGARCPECGHEKLVERREIKHAEGELVEIGGGERIVIDSAARDEASQIIDIWLKKVPFMTNAGGQPMSPWVAFYKAKEATKGRVDETWLRVDFRRRAKKAGFFQ